MAFIELTEADVATLQGICDSLGVPRFDSGAISLTEGQLRIDGNNVLTRAASISTSGLLTGGNSFSSTNSLSLDVPKASEAEMFGSIDNKATTPNGVRYYVNSWANNYPSFGSGFNAASASVGSLGVSGSLSANTAYLQGATYVYGDMYFDSGGSLSMNNGTANFGYGVSISFTSNSITYDTVYQSFNNSYSTKWGGADENWNRNVSFYSSGGTSSLYMGGDTDFRADGRFAINKTPVSQQSAIEFSSGSYDVVSKVNEVISVLRVFGFIST